MPAEERKSIAVGGQGPLIRALDAGRRGQIFAAIGSGTRNGFFGAARFRPGGSLDTRFGTHGFVRADRLFPWLEPFSEIDARGVALQRNGKIVLAGFRTGVASEAPAPLLIRLRPDGTPDRSFGAGGAVAPKPDGRRADSLRAVAVQASGRIIAVGVRNERDPGAVRVRRPSGLVVAYRPDGSVDPAFGRGGRVLFAGGANRYTYTGLFAVALLPSGKILVAGYRSNRLLIARLRANGRPDRGFGGGDGEVSIGLGLANSCCPDAAAIAPLPNGGSVVLADVSRPGAWLLRLRPDGAIDHRFGRGGIVKTGPARRLTQAHAVAVQGNGRIVAAGIEIRRRTSFVAARFKADGRPDRSFGKGGVETLPLGRASAALAAKSLPDGRVLLGGGDQAQRGKRVEYALLLARLAP